MKYSVLLLASMMAPVYALQQSTSIERPIVGVSITQPQAADETVGKAFQADLNDKFFTALTEDLAGQAWNEMAEMLANREYDPTLPDEKGRTPLMWAARLNRKNMIEWLLALGVDTTAQDKQGYTFLHYAHGKPLMIQAIVDYNKKVAEHAFVGDFFKVMRYTPRPQLLTKEQILAVLNNQDIFQIRRYRMPEAITIPDKFFETENQEVEIFLKSLDAEEATDKQERELLVELQRPRGMIYLPGTPSDTIPNYNYPSICFDSSSQENTPDDTMADELQ